MFHSAQVEVGDNLWKLVLSFHHDQSQSIFLGLVCCVVVIQTLHQVMLWFVCMCECVYGSFETSKKKWSFGDSMK